MSLIRKHGAVLQAWACLDLVFNYRCYSVLQFGQINQSANETTKRQRLVLVVGAGKHVGD